MLQFRYLDPRLKYRDIAPHQSKIFGGKTVHDLIWTPSVFVANEHNSVTMGTGVKDLLISIDPEGMIILNTR